MWWEHIDFYLGVRNPLLPLQLDDAWWHDPNRSLEGWRHFLTHLMLRPAAERRKALDRVASPYLRPEEKDRLKQEVAAAAKGLGGTWGQPLPASIISKGREGFIDVDYKLDLTEEEKSGWRKVVEHVRQNKDDNDAVVKRNFTVTPENSKSKAVTWEWVGRGWMGATPNPKTKAYHGDVGYGYAMIRRLHASRYATDTPLFFEMRALAIWSVAYYEKLRDCLAEAGLLQPEKSWKRYLGPYSCEEATKDVFPGHGGYKLARRILAVTLGKREGKDVPLLGGGIEGGMEEKAEAELERPDLVDIEAEYDAFEERPGEYVFPVQSPAAGLNKWPALTLTGRPIAILKDLWRSWKDAEKDLLLKPPSITELRGKKLTHGKEVTISTRVDGFIARILRAKLLGTEMEAPAIGAHAPSVEATSSGDTDTPKKKDKYYPPANYEEAEQAYLPAEKVTRVPLAEFVTHHAWCKLWHLSYGDGQLRVPPELTSGVLHNQYEMWGEGGRDERYRVPGRAMALGPLMTETALDPTIAPQDRRGYSVLTPNYPFGAGFWTDRMLPEIEKQLENAIAGGKNWWAFASSTPSIDTGSTKFSFAHADRALAMLRKAKKRLSRILSLLVKFEADAMLPAMSSDFVVLYAIKRYVGDFDHKRRAMEAERKPGGGADEDKRLRQGRPPPDVLDLLAKSPSSGGRGRGAGQQIILKKEDRDHDRKVAALAKAVYEHPALPEVHMSEWIVFAKLRSRNIRKNIGIRLEQLSTKSSGDEDTSISLWRYQDVLTSLPLMLQEHWEDVLPEIPVVAHPERLKDEFAQTAGKDLIDFQTRSVELLPELLAEIETAVSEDARLLQRVGHDNAAEDPSSCAGGSSEKKGLLLGMWLSVAVGILLLLALPAVVVAIVRLRKRTAAIRERLDARARRRRREDEVTPAHAHIEGVPPAAARPRRGPNMPTRKAGDGLRRGVMLESRVEEANDPEAEARQWTVDHVVVREVGDATRGRRGGRGGRRGNFLGNDLNLAVQYQEPRLH